MNKKPLRLVYVRDIIKKLYPGNKWLVEKLITSETITLLSGSPASFKTFISIHLAQCVSEGKDFLGQFKVPSKFNVLVLDKENQERDLKERFLNLDMFPDSSIQYAPDLEDFLLSDEKDIERLVSKIQEHSVGLLIIDSLRRFHRGDENSSGEVALIFDNLRKITKMGVSVVIIHHHRKEPLGGASSSNSIRGSSDIFAAVDCHIALDHLKKDSLVMFTPHKLRQGKLHDEFAARILTDEETNTKIMFEYVGDFDRNAEKHAAAIRSVRGVFERSEGKELVFSEIKSLTEGGYSDAVLRFALGNLVGENYLTKTTREHGKNFYRVSEPAPALEVSVEN